MNRLLQLTAILALVGLCAPALAETLHGTLYKDKNCPCCEGHARYLEWNGIDVDIKPVDSAALAVISKGAGIPADYQGCHTIMLEGYAIEGHITLGTFLVGLGWAAANVASTALIADHAETAHRGRAIGVSETGSGAMTLLAAVVTGPLIECASLPAAGLAAALVAVVPLAMLAIDKGAQWRAAGAR
jgi:MFS family permease